MKPGAGEDRQSAPPLAAWAIAAVASLLIGIGSYAQMRRHPPPPTRAGFDHAAAEATLDELAKTRGGPHGRRVPLVLAVGTSLYDAAFPTQEVTEELLRRVTGFEVDFRRFVAYRTSSVHELIPYFDRFASAHPDVVLLEDQVLSWSTTRPPWRLLVEHRRYLVSKLRSLFGTHDLAFADPIEEDEQKWDELKQLGPRSTRDQVRTAFERLKSRRDLFIIGMRAKEWGGCPDSLPGPIERFLAAAQEQGISVIVTHVTPAEEVREIAPSGLAGCYERLTSRLGREYGIPYWRSPAMPTDHYLDFLHYDEPGRKASLRWLLPRLGKVLRQRRVGVR